MKICMISRDVPPTLSGPGFVAHYISNELSKKGHEIVVVHDDLKFLPKIETYDEIRNYEEVNCCEMSMQEGMAKIFKKTIYLMKKRDMDLIHFHFDPIYAFPVFAVMEYLEIPIVSTVHDDISLKYLSEEIKIVGNELLCGSTKITTVTQRIREYLTKELKISEHNISVIPNGVDSKIFFPMREPQKNTFVYVGRLSEEKGIDTLLQAMREVTNVVNCRLIIVGDGPTKEHLEKFANDLKVQRSVDFVGSKTPSKLPLYYNMGEFAIFPHLDEGFSLTMLEALSCGRPVIFPFSRHNPDLLDFEIGVSINEVTVDELATAILELLKEKDKAKMMGKKGRKFASQLNWKHIANNYETLYSQLLKN